MSDFSQPEVLWLGLYPGDKKLKENIGARLRARLKRGMLAEAKRLHKEGLSFKRMDELGLEYRYMAKQLTGELSSQETAEALERAIGRYAKRQMRWFKRNKDIKWVGSEREALALAKAFISG